MTIDIESISQLIVFVNGKKWTEINPNPLESLISFLRRHGLTGTKLGCSEGGCGSCTVIVGYFDYSSRSVRYDSVNSCLATVGSVHLKHVITIEALGTAKALHPVQEAIALNHGSQCGFCTPGIVMSLYAALKENPHADEHEIEDSFDGNLCRCTGYRPILDGAKQLVGKCGQKCVDCKDKSVCHDIEDIFGTRDTKNKALVFPQELFAFHSEQMTPTSYVFEHPSVKWFHPSAVQEVLELMNQYPHAKIVNGNTELGIEVRFKNQNYPVFINTFDVIDLKQKNVKGNEGIEIGAAVTIASLQKWFSQLLEERPKEETRSIKALLDNMKYFAGRQVRNVSAIAGNIATASPISDLNPVLVAAGAILTVSSTQSGSRQIPMTEFFLGYRKTALQPGELLISIWIPFTKSLEFMSAYKQAKRRDDDIAIANAGLRVALEKQANATYVVKHASFAFGGMGPTTLLAKSASSNARGKVWSETLIHSLCKSLLEDMPMSATAPGGQVEFRKTLAQSFLYKFYLDVLNKLSENDHEIKIDSRSMSSLNEIERGLSSGKQVYTESTGQGVVGKSVTHASALKQVTGEAIYVDDIPKFFGELYGVIVQSTIAHGKIKRVDPSEALSLPGVMDFVSAKDVSGSSSKSAFEHNHNIIGPVFHDEELFATEQVCFVGQMIGLILAESEDIARRASKLVKIEYEQLPGIYSIEDAIEAQSFFTIERKIETGEYKPGWTRTPITPLSKATHHVKGQARISAQEHFYLETQASLVVPGKEDDEIEIYSSTQNPTETQHYVAHVLGIPSNRVVCRVKRLGGGFGGKETRSVFLSCALAIAAKKHSVPIRCMLTREEDMVMTGTRHPFLAQYDIGFTDEGKLISAEIDLYSNGGYSMDLSLAVLERSMTHIDNSYKIPNMKIYGRICKTNTPTNTAFRGFGGPQGMMIAEHYMSHIAEYLGKPVEEIRRINLYQETDITHFDMPLENVYLKRAWEELLASSEFETRKKAVADYNTKHKYRKRGIAMMPTKFGLAFTARFLNQAGALVHIYTDGSVRITHGGTEMGQGLHTKMLQIVADAFGISLEKVFLSETRTDTVANTSATAASVSSDLNGMALADACKQINDRLKPLREAHPDAPWEDIVKKAYFSRINLSANGFYMTPDLTFDWETCSGRMFSYFTYGVACTEVEIDALTGDHVVLRSDLIMDIGRPINPAIDIGQIEGAFTQGLGWCTIEEPIVSPKTGVLFTRGPGLYKIPGFKDIPVDFRVTIMDGVRNSRAIHSSKAVGEPPLFLGASVFFAIKEAIRAARVENGLGAGYFQLASPATSERIRLSCGGVFVENAKTSLGPGEKPWGVPL